MEAGGSAAPVITNDDPFGDTRERRAKEGKRGNGARVAVSDRREAHIVPEGASYTGIYFFILDGVRSRSRRDAERESAREMDRARERDGRRI